MKLFSNSSITLLLIVFVIFGFAQNYQQYAMALNSTPDNNSTNFFEIIINFFNNLFHKQNPLQTYKVSTDCELVGVMLSMPSDFIYSPTVQKKYPDEWAKLVKLGQDSKFRYQMQQVEENIGQSLSNTGTTGHVEFPSDFMEIVFSIISKEYSINPKLKDDFFTLSQGFAPSGLDVNKCESELSPNKIPKYALSVEPRTEMVMGSGNVLRLYVQNIGSSPLTNVKIDYGTTSVILPTLNPNEKKMFSPPVDAKMVTVTSDQGVTIQKMILNGSKVVEASVPDGGIRFPRGTIKLDNKILDVQIAETDSQKTRGLMFQNELPDDEGMIFIFGQEQVIPIWMHNMQFPLDIIWFDVNGNIVHIEKQVPPCKSVLETATCTVQNADGKMAKYVLEVTGGFIDKFKITEKSKMQIISI